MECFRLLFDHLTWIERQFLSGIRDSRKAGSLWGMMRGVGGVRKSELDWPNKEFHGQGPSCVYRDNKCTVWCQCWNCTHNYLRGKEDVEDLREVCPKGVQRRSERKTLSWQQGDGRADQFRSRSSWCSGDLRWKLDLLLWLRDQEKVPNGSMLVLLDPRRPDGANPPTNFWWALFYSTGMIYMHWVPTGQTVNKEYYVEVLREFRKRFRRKRPALFKSAQWHFHKDNTPVHNSILVTVYLTKMSIKTVPHPPYSPNLAPSDFWLFPKLKEKLRGCRYETIEEMKEAVTKVIDTLTQENFHGAFEKLLERYKCIAAGGDYLKGDYSFMCVLSIKVPIRKNLEACCVLLVPCSKVQFLFMIQISFL